MRLVFVHLGPSKAEHLWANISRHQKLFPNIPVTLIINHTKHEKKAKKLGIELFQYKRTKHSEIVLNGLKHDESFRNGFWLLSIERFFALNDWHVIHPEEFLIHLESDILVLPNFPWTEIKRQKSVSWLEFNETHDVGSIFVSPDHKETLNFTNNLMDLLEKNPNLTDMTALSILRRTFPHSYSLLNSKNGFYDGAAIGMWLCGQDPRNNRGRLKKHVELLESNIKPATFEFDLNSEGNLSVIRDMKKTHIFNLHIHSKELDSFGENWHKKLADNVSLAQNKSIKSTFLIKIYLVQIFQYLLRRLIRIIRMNTH